MPLDGRQFWGVLGIGIGLGVAACKLPWLQVLDWLGDRLSPREDPLPALRRICSNHLNPFPPDATLSSLDELEAAYERGERHYRRTRRPSAR